MRETEKSKSFNTPGNMKNETGMPNMGPNKDDRLNYTTPNRGNNNFRNNGNQIGMMGNGNAPNSTGNNPPKKSPWGRNNSMGGNNDSSSFMEGQNDWNQGSGRKRPMGQGRDFKKSPWGRNNSTGDNGSPSFTGRPRDFNQGPGRRSGGQGRDFHIIEKLREVAENLDDLQPKTETRRKFSNQARIWIGNIPLTTVEEELKELFAPYGEFDEFYFDKNKGFGFVRMDYKDNAIKAQVELNRKNFNGRELKIRLSPTPGTALKIRNLSPHVTTELLEKVFEVFGELERVMVLTDDRGNSKCEGVVEYCKKPCAQMALRICTEGCLYITASLRPVIVEQMPFLDETEGLGEINVNKRETRYFDERQLGPRLPLPGSFEDEFGKRWKKLYESYDIKKKEIEYILKEEGQKLDMQMDLAKQEHETEMLRQKLKEKEEANYRNKLEFEQQRRGSGYGMHGNDFDNNFPKYEEDLFRQKEDPSYRQNFSNQRRWEDTHYDSLYNEPQSQIKRDSFSGRPMDFQGNNRMSFDHQGGNNLRDEMSGPMDYQGNHRNNSGSIDGGKNLLDELSRPVDNPGNRGKDLRGLIGQGANNQGNIHRNFDSQGMSDHQGGNNMPDELSKPVDNQGKDLRSLINPGGNNQGNRRSFDHQGMGDYDDNAPKRGRF